MTGERILRVASATHPGCVRIVNEDSYAVAECTTRRNHTGERVDLDLARDCALLLVADGAGGPEAGEIVSAAVVESVLAALATYHSGDDLPAALDRAVAQANRAALELVLEPARRGACSALLVVAGDGPLACAAHAGQSRLYLLRGGALYRATVDHDRRELMWRAGVLTPDEYQHWHWGSPPYNHLGERETVNCDLLRIGLARGDRLLLCTDGLTNFFEDLELRGQLLNDESPDETCARVIELVCQRGGHDNVTVVLAHVEGNGFPEPEDAQDEAVDVVRFAFREQIPGIDPAPIISRDPFSG